MKCLKKGLDSSEKQKGLLKRLKNIEDKTDNLNINVVNDGCKLKKIDFYDPQSDRSRKLTQKSNKRIDEIKRIKNAPNDLVTKKEPPKFIFTRSNNDVDYFDKYTDLREFGRDIQNGLIKLDEARKLQRDMKKEIDDLKGYTAKINDIKIYKNKVLENLKLPYNGIKKIIRGFSDGDFLIKDFSKEAKEDDGSEQPSGSKDKQESEQYDESEESDESKESDEVNLDCTDNATNKKIGVFF